MKKQAKTLLYSLGAIVAGLSGIVGVTQIYGANSDDAKGTKINVNAKNSLFNFGLLDANFFVDTSAGEVTVGKYVPSISDESGTVNGVPVNDFIKEYKKTHDNVEPVFRIRSGFFNLENRYLTAISPDDWYEFAVWYLGENGNGGRQVYGPEAATIKNIQIVTGYEEKSGSITLGGREISNKEESTIKYYPDAFFGVIPIYGERDKYTNRLTDYLFPVDRTLITSLNSPSSKFKAKEFTLSEATEAIELINKFNEKNRDFPSSSFANVGGSDSFSFNGFNSPKPYYLEKSSIKEVSDTSGVKRLEQHYRILGEYFLGSSTGDATLLDKIRTEFPEMLTDDIGPHIVKDEAGRYSVKNGKFKSIKPSDSVGLAKILKVIHGDKFKGMGINFLKYVAVHEYGHNFTLYPAQDISEGGVQLKPIHPQAPVSIDTLYNMQVFNDYLKARSNGLELVKVDAFGKEVDQKNSSSIYTKFKINGQLETKDQITGTRKTDGTIDETQPHRSFLNNMDELNDYVDKFNNNGGKTTLYNAVIQNSFDEISGTINPGFSNGPYVKKKYTYHNLDEDDLTTTGKNMRRIFKAAFNTLKGIEDQGLWWAINQTRDVAHNLAIQGVDSAMFDENGTMVVGTNENLKGTTSDISLPWFKSVLGKTTTELSGITTPTSSSDTSNGLDNNFYNWETKTWTSIAENIFKLEANSGEQVFKEFATGDELFHTVEIGNKTINIAISDKIKLWDILSDDGERLIPNLSSTSSAKELEAAKTQLRIYLSRITYIFKNLNWNLNGVGKTQNDELSKSEDPTYLELSGVFSDYVFNSAEAINRDFVQVTYSIDTARKYDILDNSNPFLKIRQSATSFEFYIEGSLTDEYRTGTAKNIFSSGDSIKYTSGLIDDWKSSFSGVEGLSKFQNELLGNIDSWNGAHVNNWSVNMGLWAQLYNPSNSVFGNDLFLSNGFERDRMNRESLGWGLYNTDGTPRLIKPEDNITITMPDGAKPTTWAESMFAFMLKSYGIGDRTISSLFRDPDLDSNYFYGYIPSEYSNTVKSLQLKNNSNGKTINLPVKSNDSIANIFYLEKQGDISSKVTLADVGYAGWTTDKHITGAFINSKIGIGNYSVEFLDGNDTVIDGLFNMGSRTKVAENGKFWNHAPSYFTKGDDGKITYVVKPQFNV